MNRLQQTEGWLNSSIAGCQAFIVLDDTFSGKSLIDFRLAREGVVVSCQVKIGFTAQRLEEARQSLSKQLAIMDQEYNEIYRNDSCKKCHYSQTEGARSC